MVEVVVVVVVVVGAQTAAVLLAPPPHCALHAKPENLWAAGACSILRADALGGGSCRTGPAPTQPAKSDTDRLDWSLSP